MTVKINNAELVDYVTVTSFLPNITQRGEGVKYY